MLPNGSPLPLSHPLYSQQMLTPLLRIRDELIHPLERLAADKSELAAMTALLLLPSDVSGVSTESNLRVGDAKDSIVRALFAHISARNSAEQSALRLARLLGVFPALALIGQSLAADRTFGPLMGMADGLCGMESIDSADPVISTLAFPTLGLLSSLSQSH